MRWFFKDLVFELKRRKGFLFGFNRHVYDGKPNVSDPAGLIGAGSWGVWVFFGFHVLEISRVFEPELSDDIIQFNKLPAEFVAQYWRDEQLITESWRAELAVLKTRLRTEWARHLATR